MLGNTGWSPGTIRLIRGEATRLGELARAFDELDTELRLLLPEGWAGRAYDAFTDTRARLAKQVRSVADAHETAAQALTDYADTLAELAQRRRYEQASDGLARLELQRVEAAGHAEDACRKAAEELNGVRPALPELAATPVAPGPAGGRFEPVLVRQERKFTGEREPAHPRLGDVDRAGYRAALQELSDAVLDHFSAA